jgi:hypothetical protein
VIFKVLYAIFILFFSLFLNVFLLQILLFHRRLQLLFLLILIVERIISIFIGSNYSTCHTLLTMILLQVSDSSTQFLVPFIKESHIKGTFLSTQLDIRLTTEYPFIIFFKIYIHHSYRMRHIYWFSYIY